ncbi:hypothetical protein C1645_839371 [Glomus cerebriforme]|uniref:P-loop containing nucleoside triphosphate hydrolase protein n=1 Tax=Glomus cerebriforme TaxID=658196 RepID=A0A397S0Q2_9GLOM|nr:hypothetical protein C1645_839371 [Glomus cerebriforme]
MKDKNNEPNINNYNDLKLWKADIALSDNLKDINTEEQIKNKGEDVTFEHVKIETEEVFWVTLGSSIRRDAKNNINIESTSNFKSSSDLKINSANDFNEIFEKSNWKSNIIILIDEFDKLYEADENVRSSCLETFRGIKNSKNNYAIWSIVTIGTFSILHIKSGKTSTSPFNVNEPFQNPNFTFNQVQFLYKEFEDDFEFTIDLEIIKDIYKWTSGHAGLVCLCGRFILDRLIEEVDKDNKLSFVIWSKFVFRSLENIILDYPTFRRMINTLNTKIVAKPAVNLLRSVFLGFFDFVNINNAEELKLAEFLVAEGVLIRDERTKNNFKMSSVFVDGLIRNWVIPELYKSRPNIPVPQTDEGSLKVLDALTEAIRCFDKTIICNAFNRSFKTVLVKVDGCQNKRVSRESVYDSELNRILVNWIDCQRIDIVIMSQHQTVVLELLASATKNELNKHFERVLDYAEMLSADDIWIVNFTCEDDATKEPHWPPNDGKFERVNVVHFFHNQKFENVRINAQYISNPGAFSYITDQVIQLQ